MIVVSDEWKEAHKQLLLPETFLEITIDMTDANAAKKATFVSDDAASFSGNTYLFTKDTIYRPPTLEHNMWQLDGSEFFSFTGHRGYTSKSDAQNVVQVKTSSGVNANGFTIVWSEKHEEYATDFTVVVKNNTTVLDSVSVQNNNSVVSQISLDVKNFNLVEITVTGWSIPGHRTRIDRFFFGREQTFNKKSILNYTHEQSGDVICSEISRSTIMFTLDNSDGKWHPLNPTSVEQYLLERQKVVVRYGLKTASDVEWIQAGIFYLTDWRLTSDGMGIDLEAQDVLNAYRETLVYCNERNWVPSYYGEDEDNLIPIYNTPEDILNPNATPVAWITCLDDGFVILELKVLYDDEDITDPKNYSGYALRLESHDGWVSGWVDAMVCAEKDPEFLSYMELAFSDTLFFYLRNQPSVLSISSMRPLAKYHAPMFFGETTMAEFFQSAANACACTAFQNSEGNLTFLEPKKGELSDYIIEQSVSYKPPKLEKPERLREIQYVWRWDGTDFIAEEKRKVESEGQILSLNNPFCVQSPFDGKENLLNEIISALSHKMRVSGEFRADPRLELFDIVQVETKYGMVSPVLITNIKYTYNGSFRGEYEGKVIDLIS